MFNDYYETMCDIESQEKTDASEQAYLDSIPATEYDDDWLFYPEKNPEAWLKPRYDEF